MQLSKPPKPKATRKRLKKEILSDDFKKRKNFLWKIFHLTSLVVPPHRREHGNHARFQVLTAASIKKTVFWDPDDAGSTTSETSVYFYETTR
jgi:hypothetical protein